MAARMQQRRGTAAQWTSANPILGSGEIGFETDTIKFKIGNGTSTWSNLTYFANLNEVLDGAPDLLNTLNEIAAAIGDDPSFITTIGSSLALKADITYVDEADEAIMEDIGEINTALGNKQNIVANVSDDEIGHLNGVTSAIQTQIDAKQDKVTDVSDTEIGYLNGVTSAIQTQFTNLETIKADLAGPTFTGSVILPTTTAIGDVSSDEIGYLNGVTSALQTQIDAKLGSATAAGIYAPLNDPTFGGTVSLPGTTSIGNVSSTELGYLDGVTSSIQTQVNSKAPSADPTFTGTVTGVTKAHVGLTNVDDTSDADKPVSTATQTALDNKANLSGATFTGDVTVETNVLIEGNLTISGTSTTINATDLAISDPLIYLAAEQYTEDVLDVGFLAATGEVGGTEEDHLHSGLFRDVSDDKKWKLISNVPHPVSNVVDVTNAVKDTLVVGNIEADGVVFSDGTQTKMGVPSLTEFVEKTASYTLDTLAHQDNIIEMNSTSPMTFTIPTNAALAWPIGASMDIFQTNTGEVTIAASAGVTLNRTPGSKLRTQWSSATILKRGTDSWILYGDLKA
jgi:hypothetical protein